jgi:hypothetical protein
MIPSDLWGYFLERTTPEKEKAERLRPQPFRA